MTVYTHTQIYILCVRRSAQQKKSIFVLACLCVCVYKVIIIIINSSPDVNETERKLEKKNNNNKKIPLQPKSLLRFLYLCVCVCVVCVITHARAWGLIPVSLSPILFFSSGSNGRFVLNNLTHAAMAVAAVVSRAATKKPYNTIPARSSGSDNPARRAFRLGRRGLRQSYRPPSRRVAHDTSRRRIYTSGVRFEIELKHSLASARRIDPPVSLVNGN